MEENYSWAQVLSGEQNHDESDDQINSCAVDDYDYQSQTYSTFKREGTYGSDENDKFPELNPHKDEDYGRPNYHQDEENEQEENDDGSQSSHKKRHKWLRRIFKELWSIYKNPADEQQYSEEVDDDDEIEPSEEELSDYKVACARLWELDFNRVTPGHDYEIDVGEGKRVDDDRDMAEDSLFTDVSEGVLRKPTISRFCALLDNYNPYEGCKENETDEDVKEQIAFIEEISRTAPIKYLYKYLSSTELFTESYEEFKTMLKDLWFTLYARGGTPDSSSAFEHVFVGEIKEGDEEKVSGFHNWLQFYHEEAEGRADYQGYILPRKNQEVPNSETQLLTVQFEWHGVLKSLSSMFIGVSPEFEIALYTLCFFAGDEDNHIEVGPYPVNIKCYRLGNLIGSTFPIAEA